MYGLMSWLCLANTRNDSNFHWNGLFFACLEYTGAEYKTDMPAIAHDPITCAWWQLSDLRQHPVEAAHQRALRATGGRTWKFCFTRIAGDRILLTQKSASVETRSWK
jgi:hypothetical protein